MLRERCRPEKVDDGALPPLAEAEECAVEGILTADELATVAPADELLLTVELEDRKNELC